MKKVVFIILGRRKTQKFHCMEYCELRKTNKVWQYRFLKNYKLTIQLKTMYVKSKSCFFSYLSAEKINIFILLHKFVKVLIISITFCRMPIILLSEIISTK